MIVINILKTLINSDLFSEDIIKEAISEIEELQNESGGYGIAYSACSEKLEDIKNALDDRNKEVARLSKSALVLQVSRDELLEEIDNQKILIRYLENKLGLKGDTDEL